jgi:tetratricopeptide (TPR) repeat protein
MNVRLLCLFFAASVLVQAETSMQSAKQLFEAKRYPEAREAFETLAATDAPSAEVHYYLGVLASRRGEPEQAVQQLEQATTLAPTNSKYFLELGGAYGAAANKATLLAKLNWAKKCLPALQKAVELDPDSIAARNGLISFYREAPPIAGGGIDKAFEQAEEIRKRDLVTGSAVLAQLYLSQHKPELAFETYEAAISAHPDNYQLLYLIGRTAAETGEHLDRGEQAFKRCLQLTPGKDDQGYAAVHWRLGQIAEKRNDLPTARTEYESALREHPGFQAAADSLAKLK